MAGKTEFHRVKGGFTIVKYHALCRHPSLPPPRRQQKQTQPASTDIRCKSKRLKKNVCYSNAAGSKKKKKAKRGGHPSMRTTRFNWLGPPSPQRGERRPLVTGRANPPGARTKGPDTKDGPSVIQSFAPSALALELSLRKRKFVKCCSELDYSPETMNKRLYHSESS